MFDDDDDDLDFDYAAVEALAFDQQRARVAALRATSVQQAAERRGQFAPHFTGRVVGEPGEAPRLRLSAAGLVQPAHLAHLDEVLQLSLPGRDTIGSVRVLAQVRRATTSSTAAEGGRPPSSRKERSCCSVQPEAAAGTSTSSAKYSACSSAMRSPVSMKREATSARAARKESREATNFAELVHSMNSQEEEAELQE